MKKENEEIEKNEIEIFESLKNMSDDNNPYFSVEWLKENILKINPKFEKRKKIIKKLLENKCVR